MSSAVAVAVARRTDRAKVGRVPVSHQWRSRTLPIRDGLLQVFAEDGGKISTRQAFYQLVSRLIVQNNQKEYKRVARVLVTMRRAGEIPFDRVVDRTRSKHQKASWNGLASILDAARDQYRRNYWAHQDTIVMIGCEKQALEGVFAEVCDKYGASLWVIRGYCSDSFFYEWACEIVERTAEGKRVIVSYFGDHDPSGLNIAEKVRGELAKFQAQYEYERAGLLFEDIKRFKIPTVGVKKTDSRSKKYRERYGDVAAELDALPPRELRNRIRVAIERHIDHASWETVRQTERLEQESLSIFTRQLKEAGIRAMNDGSEE